jgi:hypothetical protein
MTSKDTTGLATEKARIDSMSHFAMAHVFRYSPPGHPYFVRGSELADYFDARFKKLGGMTPQLSKQLG